MAEGDYVGINIIGRFQDQNISNTIHYRIDAQADSEQNILNSLCVDWETQHASTWLALHNAAYSLMGIKGFSLSGDNKVPGVLHIDDYGTVVGEAMPAPLCRTITLYTDSTNYRRRGRVMLSGGTAADFETDDGSVDPTTLTAMDALGTDLIEALTYAGNTFMPGLAPNGILAFEPYTGRKARKTPSLIRSRRVRGFSIG